MEGAVTWLGEVGFGLGTGCGDSSLIGYVVLYCAKLPGRMVAKWRLTNGAEIKPMRSSPISRP